MSITLHWWALPIAIILFGFIVMVWPRQSSGGYIDLSGLGNVSFFVLTLVIAGALCLGHWI